MAGTDIVIWFFPLTIVFHVMRFMQFPDDSRLHRTRGEARVALRNGSQWRPTHKA
jgi:hypothetical protein